MSIRAIIKFVREIAIGMVAVIAAGSFLGWVVGDSIGLGFFLYIGIVPLFLLVVMLLAFTGRFAALPGLLGAIAVMSAIQYTAMRIDVAHAEARMSMSAPEQPRAVDAVDLSDLMDTCDSSCVEILAKTGADVVLRDHIYRLARGDMCRAGVLRPLYFEFLKAGYAGMCAEELPASRPPSLLAVDQIQCDGLRGDDVLCDEVPQSFTGYIFAVHAEDAAGSRLLDRWLVGKINPITGWFRFVGLGELHVGDQYEFDRIASRAFGIRLKGAGITGDGDLDRVLSEIETFLDDPKTGRSAAYHMHQLSAVRGRENPALLRSHILHLLQSSDHIRIRAGLELISEESRVDVRDLRPQIELLSQSLDPLVGDGARLALMRMPPANKAD